MAVNKAVKRWSIFLRHGRTGKAIVGGIWLCSFLTTIPIAYLHEINLHDKCRINFLTVDEKCQFYVERLEEMNKKVEQVLKLKSRNLTDVQLDTLGVIKAQDSRPVQCETDP